jgi:hypothetical protein
VSGHTENFFSEIVVHRKASKGDNASWKHQHQSLVETKEGGNLPRYKEEATAKTGWLEMIDERWAFNAEANLSHRVASVCWGALGS